MSTKHNLNDLLKVAILASERMDEAAIASARAHDLQMGDEAEAISAWDELYVRLIERLANDSAARSSQLGRALMSVEGGG